MTLQTSDGLVPAFEVIEPSEQAIPFVFCSPHSGRDYPRDLLAATRLGRDAIRRSEDIFVDQLFAFAPGFGAPMIQARFPRAYLDVNREPFELDPKMFDEALPAYVNTTSLRVAGGLGTIPKIVAENEEIYRRPLSVMEGLRRIEMIYKPFHAALERLLMRTREQFGFAILIDCHSMPSSVRALPGGRRPHIVIGDRYGTSASSRLVAMATAHLTTFGFDVARNKPYAGGYITENYGRPSVGLHAIQIEINRSLYADEREFRPHGGFELLREELARFVARFAADVAADESRPAAAE
ncbi:N-formylglutamate amidohydrolase [Jiella sp. MQZ9-1]|uniref:N-formylglutamate amidohydrolase n=1 Tax=Jiella flava TaxID=2816857 RepID=A0A939FXU3_9HYPH|nr:N-formylglutamate amidohydrolase [Jiella flava]MBO0661379.1 N-formylglutamate amidohydrolase [Jiella flava]MCD2470024.1 N-formylglutamate amidohydrolase [Jiella flava]